MDDLEKKIEARIEEYKKHAEKHGFRLNPNENVVKNIVRAIFKREETHGAGYCPCRVVSGDKEKDKEIICPCIFHKDEVKKKGRCICWLFVAKE